MNRKKEPPKPYYTVLQDFLESLEAHAQAANNLYSAVTTALTLQETIKDPVAKRMLEQLRKHADTYRTATYEENAGGSG